MDFGGLLVLGIVWVLFNLLTQGKGKTRPAPRVPPPGGAGGRGDATQQEGSRLEQLLRELERNLEGVGGTQPPGRARPSSPRHGGAAGPPAPLPEEEDVEERDSLEQPARVVSLETDVQRPLREVYDQDTDAEALVNRRIEAARSRDRALSRADHKLFDARIRQEPAEHTAVPRYTAAQLRDAIVWREILGPPVSERDS